MIEKMKFLSITGPKSDIDRVVSQYLSHYEIHLENALSELKTAKGLRPFTEVNPYRDSLQFSEEMAAHVTSEQKEKSSKPIPDHSSQSHMSAAEADSFIMDLHNNLLDLDQKRQELQKDLDALLASENQLIPYSELDYNIHAIMEFKYIRFRFGRIAREYYDKFEKYVYDTIDTFLYKCHQDNNYVWIVYFVPASIAQKIDAIYTSMHFERFYLPDEYEGTPKEAIQDLETRIDSLKASLKEINTQITDSLQNEKQRILDAHNALKNYTENFNVRKLAALTQSDSNTFYILCGWMTAKDASAFQAEVEHDENTYCIIEDDHDQILSGPPTKLKNPKLFRPFEMFIRMYGLPAYNEFDPTILIGITYSFLFGFMFGDVGQGLCLMIGGFLLYKLKKMDLAAIISCCGFFSTIFGFMFGSIFGFEDILSPIWLRPASAMTELPFIGKLNTVFIVAIALGMGIILLTMVLNIINSIHSHDAEKTWFDTNGVAGLVFYASLAATIVLYMSNKPLPATILLVVMFVIPLLLIFLKEPLTALVEKKTYHSEGGKVMFFVQGFFELFEVLLSYFSNTLSFVRVGAFAVSHAAMMEVVLMLAGVESGSPSWIVVILGNLFVCGMEGLIVGIQVLRLEYYELFSRFYHGTGREFQPFSR